MIGPLLEEKVVDHILAKLVKNITELEITSEEYGSGSNIEIIVVDTNSAAQLGFSVGAGIGGVDVSGSIGGVPAIGSGSDTGGGDYHPGIRQ